MARPQAKLDVRVGDYQTPPLQPPLVVPALEQVRTGAPPSVFVMVNVLFEEDVETMTYERAFVVAVTVLAVMSMPSVSRAVSPSSQSW